MKYVYKIIAAILSLAAIPIAIFADMFTFKASSSALDLISAISGLTGNTSITDRILEETGGVLPKYIGDSYSIYELYDLATMVGDGPTMPDPSNPLVKNVITFAIILAIALIFAIVTAVFAIVCKNNRKVIFASIGGITFSLMLTYAFESIAEPILSGELSLASITGISWISFIAEFEELFLDTPFWFLPLTFAAAIVWTVIYNATLPEKEKKERKIMLGEVEE